MQVKVHKAPQPRKKFATIQAQVAENIHRTGSYIQSLMVEFFKQHGLTPQQYNVLRVLDNAENQGLPSLEIGRRMVQKLPDITRLIDRIEKQGWVVRERSATDRRVVYIYLTEEGTKLVKSLEQPIEEFAKEGLNGLDSSELETLNALLEKVRGD